MRTGKVRPRAVKTRACGTIRLSENRIRSAESDGETRWAGASFAEWVELLAPHTEHLHLVDATGVDGEGVQVGDGEGDWPVLAEQLDRLAPQAGFIPEIWQGHVNNGAGFWTALDRLERWF